SGSKRLQRQRFGPPSQTTVSYANGFVAMIPSYCDMWWGGPQQNGWGIAIAQQYATQFAVLFTYDAVGSPTWFVASSINFDAPQNFSGTLFVTHGSPWLGTPYDPSKFTIRAVGDIRIRYLELGDGGSIGYVVDGKLIQSGI